MQRSLKQINLLKKIPLFSCLDEPELRVLIEASIQRSFPKKAILFNEGDATDSLYIIRSGRVKASIVDDKGKEVILSMFGPGDYFGEIALIDGKERSAAIMTREPVTVLIISRKNFRNLLSSNPDLSLGLLKGLVGRLRDSNKLIEDLALKDVYGRVARLFTHLAKPDGEKFVVEEKLTHQEISNMIGSSREMVSRLMKDMINGGYISVYKKRITINHTLPYTW
ncbi:MAG: Crp/Fnr family transcriptional regulator [Desulfobacterales bacterium]|nr:Crp/Fnr family transcriptional regulator [Desulfobacterales bacterium]